MAHSPEKLYMEHQPQGHVVILLMGRVNQECNVPNSPYHNNQTGKGKRDFRVQLESGLLKNIIFTFLFLFDLITISRTEKE